MPEKDAPIVAKPINAAAAPLALISPHSKRSTIHEQIFPNGIAGIASNASTEKNAREHGLCRVPPIPVIAPKAG
jgi:hypothetical protein